MEGNKFFKFKMIVGRLHDTIICGRGFRVSSAFLSFFLVLFLFIPVLPENPFFSKNLDRVVRINADQAYVRTYSQQTHDVQIMSFGYILVRLGCDI